MRELDVGTNDLRVEIDDGVATFTLNRPERRNALTQPMLDGLARGLEQVEIDEDVGVVVLTGAGGAFCAGGDVKAMAEQSGPARPDSSRGSTADSRIYRPQVNQRTT